ncbi:MAG: hypothetical protein HY700_02360 [Gemmatimonadetes bacterium]|nr:hypothetical protein [Gemmatimonadota bacterium]
MIKAVAVGLVLTAAITLIERMAWGPGVVVAAVTFGLLATAIQAAAVWKLKPALGGAFTELIRGWALGMGLRLAGVILIAVAVVVDRGLFPPLPAALAYLGVLIPLLFGEIYLAR